MIDLLFLTHNRLDLVQRCFASLPPVNGRILVFDNASSDGTLEWVKEWGRAEIYESQTNLGMAGGRRFLLTQVSSPLVAILDSDVVFSEGWLEPFISSLRFTTGILGHHGHYVDWARRSLSEARVGKCDVVSGYCQIFRRELLDRIQIDPAYGNGAWEDLDFCIQVKKLGLEVERVESGLQHSWGGSWERSDYARNKDYFFTKWKDGL